MSKKKESIEVLSTEEIHERLKACINCVYEELCDEVLPFPINLCECCDRYKKKSITEVIK